MANQAQVLDTEVVSFGVLDWAKCADSFGHSPASDVYFLPNFKDWVVFYLAMGMYKMYFTKVEKVLSTEEKLEYVWLQQGNNPYGDKVAKEERSLSMSDIVVFSDGRVYLADQGWTLLNPSVVNTTRPGVR